MASGSLELDRAVKAVRQQQPFTYIEALRIHANKKYTPATTLHWFLLATNLTNTAILVRNYPAEIGQKLRKTKHIQSAIELIAFNQKGRPYGFLQDIANLLLPEEGMSCAEISPIEATHILLDFLQEKSSKKSFQALGISMPSAIFMIYKGLVHQNSMACEIVSTKRYFYTSLAQGMHTKGRTTPTIYSAISIALAYYLQRPSLIEYCSHHLDIHTQKRPIAIKVSTLLIYLYKILQDKIQNNTLLAHIIVKLISHEKIRLCSTGEERRRVYSSSIPDHTISIEILKKAKSKDNSLYSALTYLYSLASNRKTRAYQEKLYPPHIKIILYNYPACRTGQLRGKKIINTLAAQQIIKYLYTLLCLNCTKQYDGLLLHLENVYVDTGKTLPMSFTEYFKIQRMPSWATNTLLATL